MQEILEFKNVEGHTGNCIRVNLSVDTGGYLELGDTEMDWIYSYAKLSKEQMAELGSFLLEASECG